MKKNSKEEILNDFYIAWLSRQLSMLGRKEVLTGKAKFGIFGDGKELAQVALAKYFNNGDWRSGYYRDQTFMMAAGIYTAEEFFAQLYGQTDVEQNPGNAGRVFNNHFATRSLNPDGSWKNLMAQKNSSADISPTAGQMARLLGLAYASKLFRNLDEVKSLTSFSNKGNEVAFGTIGDSSTSEGHFWETMNAASVLQVPMVMAVWDDGFGISVSRDFQTVKSSISEALKGFEKGKNDSSGLLIYKVKGWDYPEMVRVFAEAVATSREQHVPVLLHVIELTQPQGHSTSGSHERYKSKERLEWEVKYDCLLQFRLWIETEGVATAAELDDIIVKTEKEAREAKKYSLEKVY